MTEDNYWKEDMTNIKHYKGEIARGLSHNYANFLATEEKKGEYKMGSLRQ